MKIVTGYTDGQYWFREAEPNEASIEVPDSTVEMWRAVFQAENVVQRQLRDLDDALYELINEKKES